MTDPLRVPIRVKPGSSRSAVGGGWGHDPIRLVVAVSARAIDGKANAAVVDAVAASFGVRRRTVSIVSGQRSRSKTLEITHPPAGLAATLERILSP